MDYNQIINKKENNHLLTYEELSYIFNGYLENQINDLEMTRMLKAICKYSLTEEETLDLTEIFIKSGETIDLSNLGMVVDKHSTGGVGDKITLIIGPIVAALGVKIAKMSGRGLGHTGGTIDKLESIKGFNIALSKEDFIKQINDINIAITSQTSNVVPMDKKIYALRDVTNTTKSIPLIASSIMSKKIACGATKILIDVKVGKGALIDTLDEARQLSELMIKIGQKYNREVICMLTNMDYPLGNNIGNGLEILEAIDVLKGRGEKRLTELAVAIASYLVSMAKEINIEQASNLVNEVINNDKAYQKFIELVNRQQGNINNICICPTKVEVYANKSGYITGIDAYALGLLTCQMGAGRITKDDIIDYGVGIVLNRQIGDKIIENDLLCTIYIDKTVNLEDVLKCFKIEPQEMLDNPLIYQIIK